MEFRPFKKQDLRALIAVYAKNGYSFPVPDFIHSEIGFTLLEQDQIVGWVGAELRAEVVGIFDPDWGSPHQRVRAFARMHLPVAEALDLREVRKAYVFLDPKFPKFGRRLSKLGWAQTWEGYWMSVKDCIRALRHK